MDVFSYELGKKSGGGSGGGIQYVEIQMGATPILKCTPTEFNAWLSAGKLIIGTLVFSGKNVHLYLGAYSNDYEDNIYYVRMFGTLEADKLIALDMYADSSTDYYQAE